MFLIVAEMASSSASGTVGQLVKPEYRNWLALGYALINELRLGLRPFINREMVTFYQNLKTSLAMYGPCKCVYFSRRRPNRYHDMGTCAWANILQRHHQTNRPNWEQSDATKWLDPLLGPWEIAKLFLPDFGGHVVITKVEDMDITGILNLMYFCNHFTISQYLINDVRKIRNEWAHISSLELTDANKKIAFDAIKNLLSDPGLAHDPDIQKALREIGNLQGVSDLRSMEAQVLADFKEEILKELSNINTELAKLPEERNKFQKRLREQLEMLHRVDAFLRLADLKSTFLTILFSLFCYAWKKLLGSVKGIRRKNVVAWLMLLLLLLLPSPCAASPRPSRSMHFGDISQTNGWETPRIFLKG